MKYHCKKCGAELPADMTKECPCLSCPALTIDPVFGGKWVLFAGCYWHPRIYAQLFPPVKPRVITKAQAIEEFGLRKDFFDASVE